MYRTREASTVIGRNQKRQPPTPRLGGRDSGAISFLLAGSSKQGQGAAMGRRVLALVLCGTLLFACIGAGLCSDETEALETDVEDVEEPVEPEEEKAFLIIRKYIEETEVVTGRNYTLKIDIYNAGSG